MNSTSNFTCISVRLGVYFLPLSISLFVTSLFALTGNAFITLALYQSRCLNSNSRLLLMNFTGAMALLSTSVLGKSIYSLGIWHKNMFALGSLHCALSQIVLDIAASAAAASVSCIGLERLIGAFWKQNFTDPNRASITSRILTVGCWIAGLLTAFLLCTPFLNSRLIRKGLCYCHLLFTLSYNITWYVTSLYIAVEAMTITLFLYLHHHSRAEYTNFTLRTHEHSLAKRHEMLNNIKTMLWLMPSVILHGIFYISLGISAIFFVSTGLAKRDDWQTITFALVWSNFLALEPCLQVCLILARNKTFRNSALNFIPGFKKALKNEVVPVAEEVREEARGSHVPSQRSVYFINGHSTALSGVIDFHMRPRQHDEILQEIWRNGAVKN